MCTTLSCTNPKDFVIQNNSPLRHDQKSILLLSRRILLKCNFCFSAQFVNFSLSQVQFVQVDLILALTTYTSFQPRKPNLARCMCQGRKNRHHRKGGEAAIVQKVPIKSTFSSKRTAMEIALALYLCFLQLMTLTIINTHHRKVRGLPDHQYQRPCRVLRYPTAA